jgi:hypothetical protein
MDTQLKFRELLDLIKNSRDDAEELRQENLDIGLSREAIESAIKIKPVPDSLISIYLCFDSNHSSFSQLIPFYNLIELHNINSVVKIFQNIRLNHVGNSDHIMPPDMIPFLQDGAGYYICVRTLVDDQSVWVVPKDSNPRKINTNIDHFILTAIECYRQEAYYPDDDDGIIIWDSDQALCKQIVRSIDPEIEDYFPP